MTNEDIDQRIADAAGRVNRAVDALYDVAGTSDEGLLGEPLATLLANDCAWLIEQLRSSRLDSARLDWLEKERGSVTHWNDEPPMGWAVAIGSTLKPDGSCFVTLREAIDAAKTL